MRFVFTASWSLLRYPLSKNYLFQAPTSSWKAHSPSLWQHQDQTNWGTSYQILDQCPLKPWRLWQTGQVRQHCRLDETKEKLWSKCAGLGAPAGNPRSLNVTCTTIYFSILTKGAKVVSISRMEGYGTSRNCISNLLANLKFFRTKNSLRTKSPF